MNLEAFYASLTNPRWHDAVHTSIMLDGVLEGEPETFLAMASDPEAQGAVIFNAAVAGEFGPIGAFVPPPESLPALLPITDRQFYHTLATHGLITQQEALAEVRTGAFPAKLQTVVDSLPPDKQFEAEMTKNRLGRYDSLTELFREALGMSAEDFDAMWREAMTLGADTGSASPAIKPASRTR